MRHSFQLVGLTLLWLVGLNKGWDCPCHNGLGAHVKGVNFHFFRGHWQSPCTDLTAGRCLPLGLCKGTVKQSILVCCMAKLINLYPMSVLCQINYRIDQEAISLQLNACGMNIKFNVLIDISDTMTLSNTIMGVTEVITRVPFGKVSSSNRLQMKITFIHMWNCLVICQQFNHSNITDAKFFNTKT